MSSSLPEQGSVEYARQERSGLPFWVATPVRLVRFPGVLFAVMGAALILAVATAAGPLFLSSAGTAALGETLALAPGTPALTVVGFGPGTPAFLGRPDRALRAAGAGVPELGPPVQSVVSDLTATRQAAPGSATPVPVRLITRTGFLSHVRLAGPSATTGLWLTQETADALGVGAGDQVRFQSGLQSTTASVAGLYQAFTGPLPAYWLPLRTFLLGSRAEPVPPVILADPGTVTAVSEAVQGSSRVEWDFPLRDRRLALPQAERLAGQLQLIQQEAADPNTPLGASFQRDRFGTSTPFVGSPIPGFVEQAGRIGGAIQGPVETIALAGRVLALLGVAAAGAYGIRRRRVEASLLAARGLGPILQGVLASLESAVPAVAGAAVGWLLALGLVRLFGPSKFIEAAAERSSIATTSIALAVGVALLGMAAAVAARLEFEEAAGRLPQALSRTPWEAVVLLLAGAAFYEIATRGSSVVSGGPAPHLDRLLLLFPLLFIAGLGGLAVRGMRAGLVRLRGAGARWRAPLYLALRRLSSAPRLAVLLVTASSLAIGILVFAAMVSSSVDATTREKALTAVGSDVSVPLPGSAGVPAGLAFPATIVAAADQASLVPEDRPVRVLAIDPGTFARAAFWDPRFSDRSLAALVGALGGGGARVPAIAAGAGTSDQLTVRLSGVTVPLRVVGRATAFPGMAGGRAVVVVDEAALLRAAPAAQALVEGGRRLWARGNPSAILAGLRGAGVRTAGAVSAERVQRTPAFLAVSWTFSFLLALGVVAGLVVLIGLVLYVQSRQQAREVAYALSRRMGLSARAHRRSVGAELGGMLVGAFVVGAALAAGATRLIYRKLDLLPAQPPAPLYRLPLPLFGAIALALLLTSVAGATVVQRRAGRANVAEVMRLAA